MILEPLEVRHDQYEQVAATIAYLISLMDPFVNDETVYDTTHEVLQESGGVLGPVEIKAIYAEAQASKAEVRSKLSH